MGGILQIVKKSKLFQGKLFILEGKYPYKYRAIEARDKLIAKGFHVRVQKMVEGWKVFYRK